MIPRYGIPVQYSLQVPVLQEVPVFFVYQLSEICRIVEYQYEKIINRFILMGDIAKTCRSTRTARDDSELLLGVRIRDTGRQCSL